MWIGQASDIGEQGKVKFSYPSSYMNTLRGNWGYAAQKTGDYVCGSAALFERDDYGPEVMFGFMPSPTTPEASNEVFDRAAALLRDAFSFARQVGVKTCVGTETPLIVPKLVQERLKAQGKNPGDPAVVQELYEGIFRRAAAGLPAGLLLVLDARRLDVVGRERGTDQGDDGRPGRCDRGPREGRRAVQAGDLRLGAGTAAGPGDVRQGAAQRGGGELHQPASGLHAGGRRLRRGAWAFEVGDSLDGRRPGAERAAVVGGPHAARCRRCAALRLRRADGHPLAHARARAERQRAGAGRLGAGRVGAKLTSRRLRRPSRRA